MQAAIGASSTHTLPPIDHEAAELVVSELVTNAIVHGAPPVDLEVNTDDGHRVRIAVSDGDPALPAVASHPPTPDQIGGRGLTIVATLSTSWGLQPTADGKQVWCEIEARHDDP